MAPLRTKEYKKRKVRFSMRAIPTTAKYSDNHPPSVIAAETATLTDSSGPRTYSYSVPGSPVSKLSPSLQLSPTLSTSSEIWHSDINPFLLPPLAYHNNPKNPFLAEVDFKEIPQSQILTTPESKVHQNETTIRPSVGIKVEVLQEALETPQSGEISEVRVESHSKLSTCKVDSAPPLVASKTTAEKQDPTNQAFLNNRQTLGEQSKPSEAKELNKSEPIPETQSVKIEACASPASCNIISNDQPPAQPCPQYLGCHPFPGYYGQHYQRSFPVMSHPNGYPLGYPYANAPPPRVGSPYQPPHHNYAGPYPYRHGSSAQRHDSVGSRGSNRDEPSPTSGLPSGDTGSAIEDDPGDLVSRIASVIPDIHMLLSRSKETHGELSLRDQLLRKAEAQSAETVKQKEEHVNQLTQRLQEMEKNQASESNKYRLHIGNLEDKQVELEEKLTNAELGKKATEELKLDLEEQKAILLRERMTLAKVATEEKECIIKEFENWKIESRGLLDAEKQKSAEAMVSKKEVEERFERMRQDFETKLNKTQGTLESSIKAERENREQWSAEREALTKSWEEERANFTEKLDEQRQALVKRHEDDMAIRMSKNKEEIHDLLMSFAKIQEGLNKDYTIEIDNLKQELTKQKEAWDKERVDLRSMVAGVNVAASSLQAEKGRLQKLIESFGEVTDIKSKGDAYYLDVFSQLLKQILNLSTTHFNHLPTLSPSEIIKHTPASLSSVFGDMPTSHYPRAACITHIVSTIITSRVFTPFLFSIGRRFDEADILFTNMGKFLRSKSTRKEAVWRQHTLYAAYKTVDAKDRFNSAAAAVIEEIVRAISHFANSTAKDAIKSAVRQIVKLAIESWRFARLEREMIEAKMPGPKEETADDGNVAFWPSQAHEQIDNTAPIDQNMGEPRKIILRLFPIILREPIHESFRLGEKEVGDQGMVYSRGLALYSDAPPILNSIENIPRVFPVEQTLDAIPVDAAPFHTQGATALKAETRENVLPVPPLPPPPTSCPPMTLLRNILPHPVHSPLPSSITPSQLRPTPPEVTELGSSPILMIPSEPLDPASPAALIADPNPSRSRAETPPSVPDEAGYLFLRKQDAQTPSMRRREVDCGDSIDENGRSASRSSWKTEVGSVNKSSPQHDGRDAVSDKRQKYTKPRGQMKPEGQKERRHREQPKERGWDANWSFQDPHRTDRRRDGW